MKILFSVLASLMAAILLDNIVQAHRVDPNLPVVYRDINCGTKCWTVKCVGATSCPANQALMPADHDCYCCNTCVELEKPNHPCNPDDCNLVDCNPKVNFEYCKAQNMAFVKRDGVCICCDTCIEPKTRDTGKPEAPKE